MKIAAIGCCRGVVDFDGVKEIEGGNIEDYLAEMPYAELDFYLNWLNSKPVRLSDIDLENRKTIILEGEENLIIISEDEHEFRTVFAHAMALVYGEGDYGLLEEYVLGNLDIIKK